MFWTLQFAASTFRKRMQKNWCSNFAWMYFCFGPVLGGYGGGGAAGWVVMVVLSRPWPVWGLSVHPVNTGHSLGPGPGLVTVSQVPQSLLPTSVISSSAAYIHTILVLSLDCPSSGVIWSEIANISNSERSCDQNNGLQVIHSSYVVLSPCPWRTFYLLFK